MEGWRLKGGWSSLRSDSPWQSPSTDSFNNHQVVQWSNSVVETRAGEQQFLWGPSLSRSGRPGWCRKNSPRLWGSKPSYTEFCYSVASHPPALVSLQCSTQKKHKGYKNPLFPILWKNNREGMTAHGQVGSATGGQWAAKCPWMLQYLVSEAVGGYVAKRWRLPLTATSVPHCTIPLQVRLRRRVGEKIGDVVSGCCNSADVQRSFTLYMYLPR